MQNFSQFCNVVDGANVLFTMNNIQFRSTFQMFRMNEKFIPKKFGQEKKARHTHTFDRLFFANKSSYEKKHRIWTNKKTTNEKHRHINGVCHTKKCDVSVKYTCSQPKKKCIQLETWLQRENLFTLFVSSGRAVRVESFHLQTPDAFPKNQ